jgi:amino acid adenylation domain-containing protein/non-ribosomal peptide synthase protein (TIGR01720 family)
MAGERLGSRAAGPQSIASWKEEKMDPRSWDWSSHIEATVEEQVEFVARGRVAAFEVRVGDTLGVGIGAELRRGLEQLIRPAALFQAIREVVERQHHTSAELVLLLNPGALPEGADAGLKRDACLRGWSERSLDVIAVYEGGVARAWARRDSAGGAPVVEQKIAELWREVLGVARVGSEDSFFLLGGNSLRLVQMLARVESAFGVRPEPRALFEAPLLREFARVVARSCAGEAGETAARAPAGIPRVSREAELLLSSGEQRLWFLWRLEPESAAYNICGTARVSGDLDRVALFRALDALAERHESLRTIYREHGGTALRVIAPVTGQRATPGQTPRECVELDLSTLAPAEREQALEEARGRLARTPFDLTRGPLWRLALVRLGATEHALVLVLHHIISDGWSMNLMVQELAALYAANVRGERLVLPALPVQYADYAMWQADRVESGALDAQLEYWKSRLGTAHSLLALPADRPRPPVQSYRGRELAFEIEPGLARALERLARERDATLFAVLLAAFKILLFRHAAQSTIRVGVPVAQRSRVELEGLIGFFVNTAVLSTELDSELRFGALLTRLQDATWGALSHQELPFEKLVEGLNPERSLSHNPLFQVMFNHQQVSPTPTAAAPGLRFERLERQNYATQFDLSLDTTEQTEGLHAAFTYSLDLFDASSVERLCAEYQLLLAAIVADPDQRIDRLALLGAAERERVLWGFNQTELDYTPQYGPVRAVHELFEQRAATEPDAVAVEFGSDTLSYRVLNARANRWAHRLRAAGVGPNVIVGICAERSLDLVIGLLAILKAGGAYLPLDPEYPAERIEYMLDNARPALVLTQSSLRAQLGAAGGLSLWCLDRESEQGASAEHDPVRQARPLDLAYCIYTSGSTGRPKGVGNSHAGLFNRLIWMQEEYRLTSADAVLQKTPFSFDVSVWEFFWPLLAGARLVIAPPNAQRDPAALREAIVRGNVTTLHFVPSMLRAFLEAGELTNCRTLRQVMCSGEALPLELAQEFAAQHRAELYNLYGPTEAAIDVTFWRCRGETSEHALSIGHPIANTQIYILDGLLEPVPVGVVGELYIAGAGLARGYVNQPGLTAERFIPNPHSQSSGARMYRSGDLARYRQDGAIEYLGRADQQVKLRGFRVELGEIEARLVAESSVRAAAVLARNDGGGELRLVAYVVPSAEHLEAVARATLRDELREQLLVSLPEYMVPGAFVFLSELPLSPNGKLDRKALPAPDLSEAQREYVAPTNAVEAVLASVWSDVLRLDRVGTRDNFFEIGGDSIVALQVVSRARTRGVHVTPKDLFQHQTIERLARVAEPAGGRDAGIDLGSSEGELALTPIQRWFFEGRRGRRDHFNQSVVLEIRRSLSIERLEAALQELVRLHPALGLRFQERGGVIQQRYATEPEQTLAERAALAPGEDLAGGVGRVADEVQQSLSIAHGPLLRASLVEAADGSSQRLVLVIHHLAVDAVSWRVLLEDLEQLYLASEAGITAPLARTSSFKRWSCALAAYRDSPELMQELGHWRALAGEPALPLPRREPAQRPSLETGATLELILDADVTRQLFQEAPPAYRTQPHDLLLSALARTLCDWSGHASLLVELEGHGREDLFPRVDVTRTVGWFTSLYPVRLSPDRRSLRASIGSVKETLRAVPRRGLGYGVLRYLGAGDAVLEKGPGAEVRFNYLGQLDAALDGSELFALAGEDAGRDRSPEGEASVLFDIDVLRLDQSLIVRWRYNRAWHTDDEVKELGARYLASLREHVAHCLEPNAGAVTPSDFPLAGLSQAELDRLPTPPREIEDIFPLSPMQQGLLLHTLLEPGSGIYVMQDHYRIDSALDPRAFVAAWEQVMAHHPALRAGFVWQFEGRLLQVIHKRVPSPVEYVDWSDVDATEQEQRIRELLRGERERGFDLGRAPLMRLRLFRLGTQRFHFVQSYHHVLIDAWCRSLLLADFFTVYRGAASGRSVSLAARPAYRDYIAWLERQDRAAAQRYWQSVLAGFEAATPLAIERLLREDAGHSSMADATLHLTPPETTRLGQTAQARKLTVNTLVQGAWAIVLSQYSGSRDVVFGVTVAGRPAELEGIQQTVGLFINTIPLRVRVPAPNTRQSVMGFLGALLADNLVARQHEHLRLIDVQNASDVPRGQPLFNSLFVFENAPLDASVRDLGVELKVEFGDNRTHTNYPLTVVVVPGRELLLQLTYDERRFEAGDVQRMLEQLRRVVLAMAAEPEAMVAALPSVSADEARELEAWNATHREYPLDRGYAALFEAQARRTPERVAARCQGRIIRYAELDRQTNELGHVLAGLGAGRGDLIALLAERGLELLAMIVATFKAQAAYIPLDPKHPSERSAEILRLCRARWLVATRDSLPVLERVLAELEPAARPRLVTFEESVGEGDVSPLGRSHTADDLAYAIYTSGSTGTPKGAMVTSAGMLNNQLSKLPYLALSERDIIAQTASQSFDISVWQFLAALLAGGCVEIVPDVIAQDPNALLAHVHEAGITVLESVPSLIAGMLGDEPSPLPSLRWMLPTGEAMPPELARRWLERYPSIPLVNAYGPAECADDVALCTIGAPPAEQDAYLPIGRPTDNSRLYVLSPTYQLQPIGVIGELCVAGVGVGRGYLGDPARTAEAFVPHPLGTPGERLYRTGDLGRRRPDGLLECVGRLDQQVKIRGYRIELGEIEARLGEHFAVRETVVLAREDVPGQKRLVAYVVPTEPVDEPGRPALFERLERDLGRVLPEYMVPRLYVALPELPLNANGKIDRKRLPAPDLTRVQRTYVRPRNDVEQCLAAIWCNVLHIERVGIHDNFFELGGDSIVAIQVVGKAKTAGLGLTPKDVFQHQTVEALALVTRPIERLGIELGDLTGDFALTPIQRWWCESQPVDRDHYNQSVMFEVARPLDVERLEQALAELVRHHDALRLRLSSAGAGSGSTNAAGLVQRYAEAPARICQRIDASRCDEQGALRRAIDATQRSLDLEQGRLIAAAYLDFGAARPGRLLMVVHHFAIDGVSWRILLEDLQAAYTALQAGDPVRFPEKTTSFKRWSELLQEYRESDALRGELEYWSRLADHRAPRLPLRGSARTATLETSVVAQAELGEEPTSALLTRASAAYRTQVGDLLLTALAHVFCAWSGHARVRVHLEGHGREDLFERTDVSRTVGWFTSLYPIELAPELGDLGRSLRAIKEQLRAVPNKGIGYGVLRYASAVDGASARLALIDSPEISFNYLGQFEGPGDGLLKLTQDDRGAEQSPKSRQAHAFELVAAVYDRRLSLSLRYNTELVEPEVGEALLVSYVSELERVLAHCLDPVQGGVTPSDFPLAALTQAELDGLPVPPRNIEDVFPLSPMQEGLLIHTLLEPDSGIYLMQERYRLENAVDPELFLRAWDQVILRHPALRACFYSGLEDKLVQIIVRQVPRVVEYLDWSDTAPGGAEQRLADLLAAERRRGFDLTRAPLLRFRLIRLAADEFYFVQSYHHILIDDWCRSLMLLDFFELYRALRAGEVARLGTPPLYRDFIAWLGRQDREAVQQYWRDTLAGFEAATPLGIDRPLAEDAGPSRIADATLFLNERETTALGKTAQRHQLTVNTLTQAAWAALLGQYSGMQDVLMGVTVAGRPGDIPNIHDTVGLFINSIPLRLQLPAPSQGALHWLKALQAQNLAMRQCEHLPLVDVQALSPIPHGEPLFHSLFVFENAPLDYSLHARRDEMRATLEGSRTHTNYPITVVIVPGRELLLQITYDERRFAADDVNRMLEHYRRLVLAFAANPDLRWFELPGASAADRARLAEWNQTERAYPFERSYAGLFEGSVAEHPERVAARCLGSEIAYGELNARANRVGRALVACGLPKGAIVGVLGDRSLELLTLIVGAFKAGAAYLPLDPKHPPERTAQILGLAQVGAVLVTRACRGALEAAFERLGSGQRPPVVELETLLATVPASAAEFDNLGIYVEPQELAYVIYTSGSTGTPKGAMVTSAGMLNNQLSKWPYLELVPSDVIAQTASQNFDISVWQFLAALLGGARVEIVPDAISQDPVGLLRHVRATGVTVLESVPAMIAGMLAEDALELPDLRWLLPTGEAMSPELARRWFARYPRIGLVNAYGPAECADDVSLFRLDSAPDAASAFLSIGAPTDNNRCYVLDPSLEPVPIGVVGELCVAGVGVGRGYLGDPARTAEVFVPNAFGLVPGERLYRTGDLARHRADGSLECVGRRDAQVKIRGYRIELGEIDARLGQHPWIERAAVVLREDRPGDKRLVAYVVLSGGDRENLVEELTGYLKSVLPEYMLPRHYVQLARLPLSPNGKVDRRALPAPSGLAEARAYEAPRTALEQKLAEIWREVLRVSEVSRDDSFFELGGHSLLATQVVSRVARRLGIELPLRALFEHNTLREFARRAEHAARRGQAARAPELVRVDRSRGLTLSYAQQRLWFLWQLEPDSPAYNMPHAVRLRGDLDPDLLGRAFASLIERHETLRTTFRQEDDQTYQVISPAIEFRIPLVELSPGPDQEARTQRWLAEEARRPFDLERGPVLRALLLRLSAREHLLLVSMHHIVSDDGSVNVLVHDLIHLYAAHVRGTPAQLESLPIQYADYAIWQRQWMEAGELERQLAYWKDRLGESDPVLELPTDRARPARMSYRGARYDFALSRELTRALSELARAHRVTPFVVVLASFQALMHGYSGQREIRVGVPVGNRNRIEVERLIGFFVNTLVLRADMAPELSFDALIEQTKESMLGAQTHQDMPFDQLVEALRPKRSLSVTPLFQVMVTDHPPADRAPLDALGDLELEWLPRDSSATPFDLMLDVEEADGSLLAWFSYSTDLFDEGTIARIGQHWVALLEGWLAQPTAAFESLSHVGTLRAEMQRSVERRARALDPSDAAPAAESTRRPATGVRLPNGSDTERRLGAIWRDLLGVERIAPEDDFFDQGGHSLLLSQLVSRIRKQLGMEVPLRALFEASTLAGMAAVLDGERSRRSAVAEAPLVRVARTEPLPLSYAQKRLWFLWQLDPESSAYNIPVGLELSGVLDAAALERALQRVIARHEAFRTRFVERDGVGFQVIGGESEAWFSRVDLTDVAAVEAERRVRLLAEAEAEHVFDLSRGPLLRVQLIQTSAERHVLLVNIHHIISDGVSMDVLLEELFQSYVAERAPSNAARGALDALGELPLQYADYAAWQSEWLRGAAVTQQLAFWKETLGPESPVLELPSDRPRPPVQSHRGARHVFSLPSELAEGLRRLAKGESATLFMVLLAAFEVILYRYSAETDIRVGVPIANRPRQELERLIGFFVNTQVLRTSLADNPSFRELLGRVKETALSAQAHPDLPFERLVEALNPVRSTSHSPLFQVMFNHQRTRYRAQQALSGLTLRELEWQITTSHFDLTLDTWEIDGVLHGAFIYSSDLFDPSRIERMGSQYARLLQSIVERPGARIDELELLGAAERSRALHRFERFSPEHGADANPFAAERSLHECIERRAALSPDAVALDDGRERLTLAELNGRANQLAHRLREVGVRPDSLVALCVERGASLVVGALAVLKAGGAYIPLDPSYPRERLTHMLEDAKPRVIIGDRHSSDWFAESSATLVQLDRDAAEIAERGKQNLGVAVSRDNLAYCIYTSGSTGGPKGVSIPHGAVLNFLGAMQRDIGIGSADRLLALTSLSFDIAVLEIYWPLCVGAPIELVDRQTAQNPVELLARIEQSGVTLVQATPATWQMLSREGAFERLPRLRMLCGGEALSHELAQTLLRREGELWNMYGPTETTVWSALHRFDHERVEPLLGGPIDNTSLYVLDRAHNPAPLGVPGEVYIGGAGLARGYLERPALTAERFVPDPFGAPGGRLYRTGDTGRVRADGALEYVGRADDQIKIRGYRVEPGEIEARLLELESVQAAAVVVRQVAAGDQRLVAYVVPNAAERADGGVEPGSVIHRYRAGLGRVLPDFMVPQHFVLLDRLPLTPNGKIDRRRLPAFEPLRVERLRVAPRTPSEERLAALWGEVLGVPEVGVHDNFFSLGGHSLLATQLVSRIREEFSSELPLRVFFEGATVAELAIELERNVAAALSGDALDQMASMLDHLEHAK